MKTTKILSILLAVMMLAAALTSCGGSGYEKAVKNYENFMNGDVTEKELKALVTEDLWEDMMDKLEDEDIDIEEALEEINEAREDELEYLSKDLEIKDVKYSFKVVDADEIDDEDDIEKLEDLYDVKIEKAYELEIEATIDINTKNVDDDDELDFIEEFVEDYNDNNDDVEYTAAKIDGKWYLLDANLF